MNAELTAWLLAGEPWVVYRTRVDLLGQPENDPQVQAARQAMIAHPLVQALLGELSGWPGKVISSHKSASQPFHRLTFLADLGMKAGDEAMAAIIPRVMAHPSEQGPFGLPMKLSQSYGGSGEDGWGWALCDAPLLVYALLKFGLEDDPRVQRALDHLIGLVRENGWPCAVSPELGDFRGPGRKDDPCPFANLAMLKALAQSDGWRDTQAARYGAEALLDLWEHSQERHPYMFYMGTDFRKLKAPFIWYDILHTLEVLSQFAWLGVDVRLQSMAALVQTRVDGQGRFTPESIWTAWKDWDFGQKKAPSRWMTFLILRMLKRIKG